MAMLTRGTSISKDNGPGKPALEKIFQNGTIEIAKTMITSRISRIPMIVRLHLLDL